VQLTLKSFAFWRTQCQPWESKEAPPPARDTRQGTQPSVHICRGPTLVSTSSGDPAQCPRPQGTQPMPSGLLLLLLKRTNNTFCWRGPGGCKACLVPEEVGVNLLFPPLLLLATGLPKCGAPSPGSQRCLEIQISHNAQL
jgi:hypothetical protein